MHYVKGFFTGDVAEWVHDRFVRYGRGSFPGPKLKAVLKKGVKVTATIEYANVLGELIAKNAEDSVNVSGVVFAKREIESTLKDFLEVRKSKSSKGLCTVEVSGELSGEELAGLYAMIPDAIILVDVKAGKQKLKFKKKKLPKPGGKQVEGFCSATLDAKALDGVKDELLFDVEGDFSEAEVSHEMVIEELVKPEGVTDAATLRKEAKRKGKIKRTLVADGKTTGTQAELLV